MERLEPILKQKFWILLFIGILMTFIGWWMATGAMAQATSERMTKIKGAWDSVPKGEVPNETWAKRLAGLNSVQESSNLSTRLELSKRQQTKMLIPQGMDQQVPYQGKFSNDEREVFRDLYPGEVQRVWKMLNPMDIDGTGVVNFPLTSMYKLMNQKPWIVSAPKSEVIWDILEDLWLLEGLFQSIADVNGGPTATRLEAVVHQIDKLELRGGGDKLPSGGSAGGSSAEGTMSGMMGMGGGGGPLSGGGMMGSGGSAAGMGGGGSGVTTVSAEFDVRDEFGDDGAGSSGTGGGGGGNRQSMSSAMMMMGAGGDGGGGGTSAAETVVKRYVSDVPDRPFKTRGFYLSVKMDHRRIPQLIAELTANDKSVWPVEILRVQMSRLHEDEITGGGPGSRSMQRFPGSMSADEGLTSSSGPLLGMTSGGAGGGNDDFSPFTGGNSLGGAGGAKSPQAMAAQAVLENTLKDPYMAQVTLCGVFVMYRKVEESPEAKPATATPGSEDAAAAETNLTVGDENAAETKPDAAAESNAAAPTTDEQPSAATDADEVMEPGSEPAEDPGEMSDQPEAKSDNENKNDDPKNENDLK